MQVIQRSYEPNGADQVDLIDLVNAKFDRYGTDEYIRAFPDIENRQLRLYRKVGGDPVDGEFVTATIENVRINFNTNRYREPIAFNLHSSDSDTLVSFLKLFAKERSPATMEVGYWEESGMKMFEGSRFGQELINLSYRTESGVIHRAQISSVYECKTQMIAHHY